MFNNLVFENKVYIFALLDKIYLSLFNNTAFRWFPPSEDKSILR